MPTCGHIKKDKTPCQRNVAQVKCWQHSGNWRLKKVLIWALPIVLGAVLSNAVPIATYVRQTLEPAPITKAMLEAQREPSGPSESLVTRDKVTVTVHRAGTH